MAKWHGPLPWPYCQYNHVRFLSRSPEPDHAIYLRIRHVELNTFRYVHFWIDSIPEKHSSRGQSKKRERDCPLPTKNTLGYASIIIMNEHACQMLGYASIIIMNEHACQMYRSGRQSFWIPMLLCLAYPPGLRRVRKTSRSVARSYGRISWSIGISPPTTELIAPNAKATYTDTFPPWSLRTPHNGTVARHGCMQLRLPCQTLFDTKGRREAHPVQTTHTIHYRLCT